MSDSNRIAVTAALLGDPARANMLAALMDGRALTAKELAYAAHVTPQTASGHLAKLADGGLLAAEKQGRHRYFRLASPLVGHMLEGVMAVPGPEPARVHLLARRRGAADGPHLLRPPCRAARCCAGGCAERPRPRCAGRRRRRGDRAGAALPRRLRRGTRTRAPGFLPPMPGLERTAAASGGTHRCRTGLPLLRTGLDRSAARHARGGDHFGRARRLSRYVRDRIGRLTGHSSMRCTIRVGEPWMPSSRNCPSPALRNTCGTQAGRAIMSPT